MTHPVQSKLQTITTFWHLLAAARDSSVEDHDDIADDVEEENMDGMWLDISLTYLRNAAKTHHDDGRKPSCPRKK